MKLSRLLVSAPCCVASKQGTADAVEIWRKKRRRTKQPAQEIFSFLKAKYFSFCRGKVIMGIILRPPGRWVGGWCGGWIFGGNARRAPAKIILCASGNMPKKYVFVIFEFVTCLHNNSLIWVNWTKQHSDNITVKDKFETSVLEPGVRHYTFSYSRRNLLYENV